VPFVSDYPIFCLRFWSALLYLDNLFYLSAVENIDLQTNLGIEDDFLWSVAYVFSFILFGTYLLIKTNGCHHNQKPVHLNTESEHITSQNMKAQQEDLSHRPVDELHGIIEEFL
jgi:hypothetical protein